MTPPQKGPYAEGQEVQVSFTARVAEVRPGVPTSATGVLLRLEGPVAITGWVDPEAPGVSVEVTSWPLPTAQGVYRLAFPDSRPPELSMDGWAFYYLNEAGVWCDLGWGSPDPQDARELQALHELPF